MLKNLERRASQGKFLNRKSKYLPNGKPSQKFIDGMEKVRRIRNQELRAQISQRGVACFTTELNNILMWSHYADGHKGFCLEFDTNFFKFQQSTKSP